MGFVPLIIGLVIASFAAIWTYTDAKKRGISGAAAWAVGVFFFLIVILPLYFASRSPAIELPRGRCPRCGTVLSPNSKSCSTCETRLTTVQEPPLSESEPRCAQCGMVADPNAKFCAQCGLRSEPKKRTSPAEPTQPKENSSGALKFAIGMVLVIAVIMGISYVADTSDSKSYSAPGTQSADSSTTTRLNPAERAKFCENFPFDMQCPGHDKFRKEHEANCLELLEQRGTIGDYSTTIVGKIKNNCGKNLSFVSVTFKLYDASENVIGTAMAGQANLERGETWKFEAIGLAKAHHHRLDELSGF